MKRVFTFCLFTLFAFQLSAQSSGLNNLGFEKWGEMNPFFNSQPTGWGSVGQSPNTTDPVEGDTALKLQTKSFTTTQGEDTAGISVLGEVSTSGITLGEPYTKCPDSLTGSIRYDLPDSGGNEDTAVIFAQAWNSTDTLASLVSLYGGKQGTWTHFKLPFLPDSGCGGSVPDSITIVFTSEAVVPQAGLDIGTQTVGGVFEVDGVQIWSDSSASDITELAKKGNQFSAHPNPAKEKVRFEFGTTAERIRIFDMTGRNVRNVQLDQSSYRTVDVSGMEEGLYIYRVEDRNGQNLHSDKLQVLH